MIDVRIARKLRLQAEPSVLVAFGQHVSDSEHGLAGFPNRRTTNGPGTSGRQQFSYLDGVRIDAIVEIRRARAYQLQHRLSEARAEFLAGRSRGSVAPLELAWPFLTVQMTIAGQQVRLLVDTGSNDLVLFKSKMPAALSDAPWRGDKSVQYASGVARLRRLNLRQVRLGARVWDKLPAWALIECRTDTRRTSTACSVC